jgi:hypothetical protein
MEKLMVTKCATTQYSPMMDARRDRLVDRIASARLIRHRLPRRHPPKRQRLNLPRLQFRFAGTVRKTQEKIVTIPLLMTRTRHAHPATFVKIAIALRHEWKILRVLLHRNLQSLPVQKEREVVVAVDPCRQQSLLDVQTPKEAVAPAAVAKEAVAPAAVAKEAVAPRVRKEVVVLAKEVLEMEELPVKDQIHLDGVVERATAELQIRLDEVVERATAELPIHPDEVVERETVELAAVQVQRVAGVLQKVTVEPDPARVTMEELTPIWIPSM